MIEAFSIRHNKGEWYHFLFDEKYTESTAIEAGMYIDQWAADKGWKVAKGKNKEIPQRNMFEIRVKFCGLNQ